MYPEVEQIGTNVNNEIKEMGEVRRARSDYKGREKKEKGESACLFVCVPAIFSLLSEDRSTITLKR